MASYPSFSSPDEEYVLRCHCGLVFEWNNLELKKDVCGGVSPDVGEVEGRRGRKLISKNAGETRASQ